MPSLIPRSSSYVSAPHNPLQPQRVHAFHHIGARNVEIQTTKNRVCDCRQNSSQEQEQPSPGEETIIPGETNIESNRKAAFTSNDRKHCGILWGIHRCGPTLAAVVSKKEGTRPAFPCYHEPTLTSMCREHASDNSGKFKIPTMT